MIRHEFNAETRVAAWERCGGYCEGIVERDGLKQFCAEPLVIGCFHFDHRNPDWMSADNSLGNIQCLCVPCHQAKTRRDIKAIAKAKRIIKRQAQGQSSRRPLPFGKGSPYKKKITGKIVKRTKRKHRHG
jgi:hypothetical protein